MLYKKHTAQAEFVCAVYLFQLAAKPYGVKKNSMTHKLVSPPPPRKQKYIINIRAGEASP
jgi:hypothetical protein